MIRLLLAFYISGLAYMAFKEQKIFRKDFIREVLTLRRYPGWSEFLASFAAVLLVGALLLPALRKTNGWVVIGAAVVSLASCFIPYEKITNPWLALFTGIAVRCLLCGGRLGGQTKKMAGLEAVFRSSDLKHPLYLVLLEI